MGNALRAFYGKSPVVAIFSWLACVTFSLIASSGFAAESYIRLSCNDQDKDGDVLVDDEYKGQCPVDLSVKPGSHRLEVVTREDGNYKWVYRKNIVVGAGVAQRVEVPARKFLIPKPPEWEFFANRNTPFPKLVRAIKADDPVAKAEFSQTYIKDQNGCYVQGSSSAARPLIYRWSGQCKAGAASGLGTLSWALNGEPEYGRTTGVMENGAFEGKGKTVFSNGSSFEGNFLHGSQRGQGVSISSLGRYEGGFGSFFEVVKGVSVKPNGEKYEGEFLNSAYEGQGILTMPDGRRFEGRFSQGQYVGP